MALRTPRRSEIVGALKASVNDVFSSVMISFKEAVRTQAPGSATSPPSDAMELHSCTSIKIEGELEATVILRCDASGASDIAHDLLMLGPDETLAVDEIDDALGECANLIVGKVKTDLLDPIGTFRLGLPQKIDTTLPQPWKPAGHQLYRLKEGVISIELWCDALEAEPPLTDAGATAAKLSSPDAVATIVQSIESSVGDVLRMVSERSLEFGAPAVQLALTVPPTPDGVYISYKLVFEKSGVANTGSLLLALPESIALACYLMMVPEEAVTARRLEKDLDRATMDAMLEIGNFIGSAVDSAVRGALPAGPKVRSSGCQGVRPGRAPVLRGLQGSLWVADFEVKLHNYPASKGMLLLPADVL